MHKKIVVLAMLSSFLSYSMDFSPEVIKDARKHLQSASKNVTRVQENAAEIYSIQVDDCGVYGCFAFAHKVVAQKQGDAIECVLLTTKNYPHAHCARRSALKTSCGLPLLCQVYLLPESIYVELEQRYNGH